MARLNKSQLNLFTVKGDLLSYTGSANAVVPAGTDGHVLVADSAQANGIKWAAAGSYANPLPFGVVGTFTSPTSDFTTWVNQGSRGNFDTSSGTAYLEDLGPATSTENLIARVKTAPSTPWTMTLACTLNGGVVGNYNGGIYLRDNSTGRIKGFATRIVDSTGAADTKLNVWSWSSSTAFNASHLSGDWCLRRDVVMMRVVNNGTTLVYQVSQDFVHWTSCLSENISGNYVANIDRVGFYINSLTTPLSNNATTGLIVHHAACA